VQILQSFSCEQPHSNRIAFDRSFPSLDRPPKLKRGYSGLFSDESIRRRDIIRLERETWSHLWPDSTPAGWIMA
jgi:hypothetical protein